MRRRIRNFQWFSSPLKIHPLRHRFCCIKYSTRFSDLIKFTNDWNIVAVLPSLNSIRMIIFSTTENVKMFIYYRCDCENKKTLFGGCFMFSQFIFADFSLWFSFLSRMKKGFHAAANFLLIWHRITSENLPISWNSSDWFSRRAADGDEAQWNQLICSGNVNSMQIQLKLCANKKWNYN